VPGKLADLAVLDADPLAVPADRIGAIAVTATLVGGQQVFGDES
jgi:predicted amidohydrolase YtcJ